MICRLLLASLVVNLIIGCGSGEEYNTLPPDPSVVVPVATTNKKPVTKPPVAPRETKMPVAN